MKCLLALMLAGAAGAGCSQAQAQDEILWWSDLEGARAVAARSGSPLLVVFR